jgi:hypothetical protein
MIVGTLNLDQSGAPRTPITKGYLKRRGQITSKAYEFVSFPNAPKTFANGITNAGTVDGNYNTRRGDVTSAPRSSASMVFTPSSTYTLSAPKSPRPGANERDDLVGFCGDTGGVVSCSPKRPLRLMTDVPAGMRSDKPSLLRTALSRRTAARMSRPSGRQAEHSADAICRVAYAS